MRSIQFNVLWACIRQQFIVSIGRNMFRFCVFISPILQGFIIGMMYINRSSEEFITYAVFGSGITNFWGTILFSSASDIDRERFMGTLETLFAAPGGFFTIITGKVIGNTLWGVISMTINIVFVSLAFGRHLEIAMLPLTLVTLILMTLSYVAMALLMAGAFTLSRNARLAMNCLEYPIFLICGIIFPLSVVPVYIHPISWMLSPTWSVRLLRLSVSGCSVQEWLPLVLGLIGVTIVYWLLCMLVFKRIDYRARKSATLGVY